MQQEAALYDRDDLWGKPPEEYQRAVVRDILDLLPADARSVLDVGCGDGFVTNALPDRLNVVGLDLGMASLSRVTRGRTIGSATSLPYDDGAFDLVMANDMLEHLPDETLSAALGEFRRVSGKYILITVPFLEELDSGMTVCGSCGASYHINHHRRSFDAGMLAGLVQQGWRTAAMVVSGARRNPIESIQRELKGLLGIPGAWESALCPFCGTHASTGSQQKEIEQEINALSWEVPVNALALRPERNECIVLYERCERVASRAELPPEGKLCLVIGSGGGRQAVEASLEVRGDHLVLTGAEPVNSQAEKVAIEYTYRGTVYRLPAPARADAGGFAVPLWFLPGKFQSLSGDSRHFLLALLAQLGVSLTGGVRSHRKLSQSLMNELAAKIGALSHELVETNKVQLEVVQAQVKQREQIRELQERVKALSERLGESPAIRKGS